MNGDGGLMINIVNKMIEEDLFPLFSSLSTLFFSLRSEMNDGEVKGATCFIFHNVSFCG